MKFILILFFSLVIYGIYVLFINGFFKMCPHCRKIGIWRFDNLDDPVHEYDDNKILIKSTRRKRCRKCREEVIYVWSDENGKELLKP